MSPTRLFPPSVAVWGQDPRDTPILRKPLGLMAAALFRPLYCRQRYHWQRASDQEGGWIDYSPEDAAAFELVLLAQQSDPYVMAVSLVTWPGYTFVFGSSFQQLNHRTGRLRAMRRIAILEEGRPAATMADLGY
jgi:hypothetical protein